MAKKLLAIILFLTPVFVLALSPQQQFAEQFQTSRVSFPDTESPLLGSHPGSHSAAFRFLFEKLFSWVPTGAGQVSSEACSTELWANRLRDPRISKSSQLQAGLIQKYFKECAADLTTGSANDMVNTIRMMSVKLRLEDHPFLRRVIFRLPGDIKLSGILALKGDFKKRPLVVLRLGVFSSAKDFLPERPWLMMLFEQSPFNVLVIENMSGPDFVANNSPFAFGGYDEGLQNILLAQILRDPHEPLSHIVESLHLFGVSLGGHGVLYASLLNGLNSSKDSSLYQSFMLACPVVNLEETMHELTHRKPFGYFTDYWSGIRLQGLNSKMPEVQNHRLFGFLDKAVSEMVRTYRGGLSYVKSIQLPPGLEDGPDFWKLNNFWPHYKDVRDPVLIFATKKDPAVPFDLNSGLLQNRKQKVDSSNIGIVSFEEGIHCTFPIPYDWKAVSSVAQAYILSHSPGFKMRNNELQWELESDFTSTSRLKYLVRPPEGKDRFIKIDIKIENSVGKEKELSVNLPLVEFDFRFLNSELHPSEQWMLERWVNQNLVLKIIDKFDKPYLRISWAVAL